MLHFPALGLFALLILGGLGLPIPEDATLILCGFLISTGAASPYSALPAVFIGMLVTDFMLYSFGRKYGRKIVNNRRFRRVITEKRIAYMEDKFRRWGLLFFLGGRQIIGLRAQIFLASGVLGMPIRKFILSDTLSALISLAIMVSIGYVGGQSLEVVKKDVTHIEHLILFILVCVFFIFLLVKHIRQLFWPGHKGSPPDS